MEQGQVSACVCVYNEEEMVGYCLTWLNSLRNVGQICLLIDSDTNDRTMDVIEALRPKITKELTIGTRQFTNHGEQKQALFQLATRPWLLIQGTDETFTQNMDDLLDDVLVSQTINAVRVPTILPAPDRRHYMLKADLDLHTRIVRRGLADFQGTIHEQLTDVNGRNLQCSYGPDILDTVLVPKYRNVYMKHHSLLKSDEALLAKGKRWADTHMIEASNKFGVQIHERYWLEAKYNEPQLYGTALLPEEYYDVTTQEDPDWTHYLT